MGFLIGGPDTGLGGLSTWGKLRCALCQLTDAGDYQSPPVNEPFNREWDAEHYFTSAATGSFLKQGFLLLTPSTQPSYANAYPPIIVISDSAGSDITVRLNASFDLNTIMAQLTGETVSGYGGTFAITAAMNDGSVIVTGAGPLTDPISSIGKLAQTV